MLSQQGMYTTIFCAALNTWRREPCYYTHPCLHITDYTHKQRLEYVEYSICLRMKLAGVCCSIASKSFSSHNNAQFWCVSREHLFSLICWWNGRRNGRNRSQNFHEKIFVFVKSIGLWSMENDANLKSKLLFPLKRNSKILNFSFGSIEFDVNNPLNRTRKHEIAAQTVARSNHRFVNARAYCVRMNAISKHVACCSPCVPEPVRCARQLYISVL